MKKLFVEHCENYLNQKLNQLNELIYQVEFSLQSESKSTAGDKHETGRAMLQLEREKLGFQLKELENQYLILRKINPEIITKIIGLGSIIETSKANYFISISASEIEINTKKYFCISSKSPIGIILFGKKVNDIFEFNGINHQILQIT